MNDKNIRLVTAESVRAGHPDKFCDQVADAILDAHLRQDLNARVAVEVFATAGKMIIGGEVTSKAEVDCGRIVADAIDRIGYTMCDLCEDSHDPLELEIRIHDHSHGRHWACLKSPKKIFALWRKSRFPVPITSCLFSRTVMKQSASGRIAPALRAGRMRCGKKPEHR